MAGALHADIELGIISEDEVSFSQEALKTIAQRVKRFNQQPETLKATSVSEVEAIDFLSKHISFLGDLENGFLNNVYLPTVDVDSVKTKYCVGTSTKQDTGSSVQNVFRRPVAASWDVTPEQDSALRNRIAKLAVYERLRTVLVGIKVETLGIPEMDIFSDEIGRKLVYLKIQNHRNPGTMHWASGYYLINGLSHSISADGFKTSLELFQATTHTQSEFINADMSSKEATNDYQEPVEVER